jgi:hypothetical protein
VGALPGATGHETCQKAYISEFKRQLSTLAKGKSPIPTRISTSQACLLPTMQHYITKYLRGGGGRLDSAAYRLSPPSPSPSPLPSYTQTDTQTDAQTEAKSIANSPSTLDPNDSAQWTPSGMDQLVCRVYLTCFSDAFCISSDISLAAFYPREEMAREMWNTAKERRLLHIRGSPASGKTMLRVILANHIHINDPSYKVFHITSWDQNGVVESGEYTRQLQSIAGIRYSVLANHATKVVILFDKSQDSYWDNQLWSDFLKSLAPGVGPIVIMFASFGSSGRMPVKPTNT